MRKHISVTRQRELLHQTLCVMPLKLIESALPWLVNSMTANEARNFVENMQLAGSVSVPLWLVVGIHIGLSLYNLSYKFV